MALGIGTYPLLGLLALGILCHFLCHCLVALPPHQTVVSRGLERVLGSRLLLCLISLAHGDHGGLRLLLLRRRLSLSRPWTSRSDEINVAAVVPSLHPNRIHCRLGPRLSVGCRLLLGGLMLLQDDALSIVNPMIISPEVLRLGQVRGQRLQLKPSLKALPGGAPLRSRGEERPHSQRVRDESPVVRVLADNASSSSS